MSIADKITQLTTIRGDIRTALSNKGVSASSHDFADFAGDIADIGEVTLPPEYQKVDYLTSTGTQRIETGLKNNTIRVPVQYEFGVNYASTSSRQLHGSQGAFYIGVVNNQWQVGQGGSTSSPITATASTWYDVTLYCDGVNGYNGKATASIKQSEGYEVWGFLYGSIDFVVSDNYSICVFSLNGQNLPSSCSVSYFKVWQGGTLQRHLIPCYRKADKVIGMYDIVNNQFYTNAGTGDFTCYPAPPA